MLISDTVKAFNENKAREVKLKTKQSAKVDLFIHENT